MESFINEHGFNVDLWWGPVFNMKLALSVFADYCVLFTVIDINIFVCIDILNVRRHIAFTDLYK